jgi:hypothetical protein
MGNLLIYSAVGHFCQRLPPLASELVRRQVAVIAAAIAPAYEIAPALL